MRTALSINLLIVVLCANVIFNYAAKSEDVKFHPVEITPPSLNFSPIDIKCDGRFAYVAGGVNGFHVFSLADPENPAWVKKIDIQGIPCTLAIREGYAYVVDSNFGLRIIDIDPLVNARVVKSIATCNHPYDIFLYGKYAFIVDSLAIEIIDISNPETAKVEHVINIDKFGSECIRVSDGYAFLMDERNDTLIIFDVDPIQSSSMIKSLTLQHSLFYKLEIEKEYLFILYDEGFEIVKIDPIEDVKHIRTVEMEHPLALDISDGMLFVSDHKGLTYVWDISDPESIKQLKTIKTATHFYNSDICQGYMYLAQREFGLKVVDIDPIETAEVIANVPTPGDLFALHVEGNHAFITTHLDCMINMPEAYSIQIVELNNKKQAKVLKALTIPDVAKELYVFGNICYVTDEQSGLHFIKYDPIEEIQILRTLDTPGTPQDVHVVDGYAYIADGYRGIQIIDLEPTGEEYITKSINTLGTSVLDFSNGFIFCNEYEKGLIIIDVRSPEEAKLYQTIDVKERILAICTTNEYAFLVLERKGVQIFDINPIESTHLIKEISMETGTDGDICVSDGYAYVATYMDAIHIIDVEPIENAYIAHSFKTSASPYRISVSGNYAYIADLSGFHIFKLH